MSFLMSSNEPKRVLICGGRDYNNREEMFDFLDNWCWENDFKIGPDKEDPNWPPYIHVIAGKARGADTLAVDWAVANWCPFTEYPADWDKHGKAAGHIRNQQMLDEGRPDFVIAFPGGRGTANMIERAKRAGVPVVEF